MITRVDKARDAVTTIVQGLLGLLGNRPLVALKTDRAIVQLREAGWILLERHDLHSLIAYMERAQTIIETGDQRLLANDGPAGNQPPDISLAEWKDIYKNIARAYKLARDINRQWINDSISQSASDGQGFSPRR